MGGRRGGGLLSIKSAHKLVTKLLIYHEIELLLLVYSVLIKTFDLKLDFCPNIFFWYYRIFKKSKYRIFVMIYQ